MRMYILNCKGMNMNNGNQFWYNCFRLALYVYEYLLHIGAQKAAQTFLNEVSTIYLFVLYFENISVYIMSKLILFQYNFSLFSYIFFSFL